MEKNEQVCLLLKFSFLCKHRFTESPLPYKRPSPVLK